MATIRFRRGDTDPTAAIQPTGLTMGEPVFNKKLNTFWIGGSGPDGFTAIWVGAEIENTLDLENASPYKLATQYAIVNQIKTIVGASAGVQTIEGLSGQIDLIFGTGISGSTSPGAITLQNTGVTRLGLSGDWRTRGVTNFGGAATGGITLGSEVWAGNATVQLNGGGSIGGLSNGDSLTGKTPMEILEAILVQYLTPSFSAFNMGFDAVGEATTSTQTFAFGMTLDPDSSTPSYTLTNSSNILPNTQGFITVSASAGALTGSFAGNLVTYNNITDTPATVFNPAIKYKGISYGSGSSCTTTFRIQSTNSIGGSFSTTRQYTWRPRIYHGRSTNPDLIYPPDSWKVPNKLSGLTTGELMTNTSTFSTAYTFTIPAGNPDEYLYFFISSFFNPPTITSGGFQFSTVGGTAGVEVTGVTLDDGSTLHTYKRYRSNQTQASAYTIRLGQEQT